MDKSGTLSESLPLLSLPSPLPLTGEGNLVRVSWVLIALHTH